MKKVLALVLAMVLVLAMFAGCGSSNDKNTTADSSTTDKGTAADNSTANNTTSDKDTTPSGGEETPATLALPVKGDYEAGPEWDGSEPTHDNGNWAQSYAVIDALAEQAKAYANVKADYLFTLACHDPADSAPGEFLTAWADAVTIATEGAIDFNIGYSGAHSSTMASLEDMKNNVIDFDWTLPCYFKGYMPLTNVIQNPALGIKNATVGSYAMWELYKSSEEIQAEFAQHGETLFVWTNCTSPLSYKGTKEVTSLSEVKGNIRANNGPAQTFVNEIGASVFGCPIGDVYTNVSTGVISYLVTDWHGIKSFSLADEGVLNYFIDTNIGCSAYCLMANSDTWASIPAEYQEAIKSVSGDYLLNLVDIWNYWESAGRYVATSNGGTIYEPSAELAAELETAYENVAATWISEQADTAVAQKIYDQAKELVEKYNAEF